MVMCEQTEINYLDGEVVWVKLGSCWWPGEVVALEKLPPDVIRSFRKPPIAVVKFFEEDTYEYVKNINSIYKYNCSRKNEFINKGLYNFRTKHGHMEKFPEDVIRAETAIGGDVEILTREEFQEPKKESYAGLFGDPKKTPASAKKGKGRGRPGSESPQISRPFGKMKEKADYKVHILVQGSKPNPVSESTEKSVSPTPSTSAAESNNSAILDSSNVDDKTPDNKPISNVSSSSTPSSGPGIYACHACPFNTTRLNVLIMHNKTHSVSFIPYTPSPVKKKPVHKTPPKSTSNTTKTPKPRKPRTEKPKKVPAKKRLSEEKQIVEAKKPKTDEEIKSSLLADWDDGEDDSNDESTMATARSPEVAVGAESPAAPTSADISSAQVPEELPAVSSKKADSSPLTEKPESSSDSKYDFCEDEDWPIEADAGRKIPRVKNPIRTEETKSLSLDDDEMSKEVAELLNKTVVPELPTIPEPLKVEENFPEPTIVKSPDKKCDDPQEKLEKSTENLPTKAIFKTKTFFRSRHSRSQDAIGKYVAEQLNAVEKLDIAESDLNGAEIVSSPEARESLPVEQVKVARLAPKIQLKKMKLEAAQQREKEKNNAQNTSEMVDSCSTTNLNTSDVKIRERVPLSEDDKDNTESISIETTNLIQEFISPTKEVNSQSNVVVSPIKEILSPTKVELSPSKVELSPSKVELSPTKKVISPVKRVLSPAKEVNSPTNKVVSPSKEITSPKEIKYPAIEVPKEQEIKDVDMSDNNHVPLVSMNENNELNADIKIPDDMNQVPEIQFPERTLPDTQEPVSKEKSVELHTGHYMNESTASAVDALLSVSRDADRVTRVISNDPPEDLFEDDNNGYSTEQTENMVNDESLFVQNGLETSSNHVPTVHTNNITKLTVENPVPESDILKEVVKENNSTAAEAGNDNTNDKTIKKPSESDLQIAETLINLPSTTMQAKNSDVPQSMDVPKDIDVTQNIDVPMTFEAQHEHEEVIQASNEVVEEDVNHHEETVICDNDKVDISQTKVVSDNKPINDRYETEHEKSENLNAAQSLVQMSECVDHKVNIIESVKPNDVIDPSTFTIKSNNVINTEPKVKKSILLNENKSEQEQNKMPIFDSKSSKLLRILEEPCKPKVPLNKTTPTKQFLMPGKEKILNFDVAKSSFKSKMQSPKQKIIIRRTAPGKNVINTINEITTTGPDKIILSRSGKLSQDGSSVQTYTIKTSPETPPESNTIIIQQKIRKLAKPPTKLTKIKPQTSLVAPVKEIKSVITPSSTDEGMFDINSMPIVLSEDLLTPESIEKMPVVMSDANIVTNKVNQTRVTVKAKQKVDNEKIAITSMPPKQQEVKTLLVNSATDVTKTNTPNILSKSSKLRGAKPMLVIDKATGKQKIIMTKTEPALKELTQSPTIIQTPQQPAKSEKFLILPSQNSPRPAGRTQKIVIDPQTGKAHMIVAKCSEPSLVASENKPVSAKIVPSNSDASVPGNTVMIITNAQGAQSRIVLTPEHEKILFPNKQQSNISQLKTITHRIPTNSPTPKTIITTIASPKLTNVAPAKTPTRIVPKQKSAIITSKGQLIVGGRVATTAQNIAPMPELRPVTKRTPEPKKIVQKTNSEPIIFLQQKSGAVMQLTAAQFEHLQRTGQIVQKTVPAQEKVIIQKAKTIEPKQRIRKLPIETQTPAKKLKQEILIAPAPSISTPSFNSTSSVTSLASVINTPSLVVPAVSNTVSVATSSPYSELENFEELLPSTAIARQQEPPPPPPPEPEPEPAAAPAATLDNGQLLAVPGEHFGGPTGTFYLCIEENGTFTPIDNRPLVLENNQLVPMETVAGPAPQPERRDILEAALANSDVFHADSARDEAPDFRDLNANVSVHCRVSETSTTLNQPIMTPVELPSKGEPEPALPSTLEDGLAVIGVTAGAVPTSLGLPITVTDPRIAPRAADPLTHAPYSPRLLADVAYEPEGSVGAISMPLLTEEEPVGKSMPILTDEGERGEEWSRRLLAPLAPPDLAEHT